MIRRLTRIAAFALALVFALASCEMNVRMDTTLDEDGSGSFTLTMGVDRELRDFLDAAAQQGITERSSLALIEELFAGLESKGWTVARDEPDSGLRFEASRAFADSAGFDAVLEDLRSARTSEDTGFGDVEFTLGYERGGSTFRSDARFFGTVDTTQPDPTPAQRFLLEQAQRGLRFEIAARMPGAIGATDGGGTVGDGAVVWRPRIGESLSFFAESSSLKLGTLLAVLVPGIALLAGLGWFLLGRRRRRLEPAAERAWTDELVAIKPAADEETETVVDAERQPALNARDEP